MAGAPGAPRRRRPATTSTPGSPSRSTASTTRRCCPTPTGCSARLTARARPRRAGPGLRRLRRRRADRAGDHDPAPCAASASTVEPYVPSRLDEGHGLSLAARRRGRGAAARRSSSRSTAASTSVAEIAAAARAGIDVIVTDHHRVPPVLPAALAVVNPHRPDCDLPGPPPGRAAASRSRSPSCCCADEPGGPAAALDLADLATIGTVADVAPIVGENRAIARLGLERLRRAPRPGHRGAPRAGPRRARRVDLETVVVRPRAAAQRRRPGRGGARGGAAAAGRRRRPRRPPTPTRSRRRTWTRRDLMKAARRRGARPSSTRPATPAATVVRGPWSVGIVGLVAARLAEDRGRPAVVGAELGDVVRASCRSDGSLDLGAALERCGDLFIRYGGHAGAAGFELPAERWDAFRERFLGLAAATRRRADPRVAARRSTWPCRRATSTTRLYRELAGLAPCGPGQPRPARRGPRPDRDPRPRRDRRPHPADPAARPRRPRRHRVRPAGPRRDRPRGRPARRRRPARRAGRFGGFEIAPARDPRRRDLGRAIPTTAARPRDDRGPAAVARGRAPS